MTRPWCITDLWLPGGEAYLVAKLGLSLHSHDLLHTSRVVQIVIRRSATCFSSRSKSTSALGKARFLLVVARADIGLFIHDLPIEARSIAAKRHRCVVLNRERGQEWIIDLFNTLLDDLANGISLVIIADSLQTGVLFSLFDDALEVVITLGFRNEHRAAAFNLLF